MRMKFTSIVVAAMLIGPAALAQNSQNAGTTTGQNTTTGNGPVNSGAGVPGLPGNKSGPAVTPNGKSSPEPGVVSPDQSGVKGLPGNKSGPAARPPKR
jgi:hypothetical protein